MKNRIGNFVLAVAVVLSSALGVVVTESGDVAAESFSLSPMYDLVTLTPGETFESSFNIVNPEGNTSDFYY